MHPTITGRTARRVAPCPGNIVAHGAAFLWLPPASAPDANLVQKERFASLMVKIILDDH